MGDIFTVTLPDIGEGVVEGEVIEWLKKVNDPLKQDEPVVVVMTDKATVELPAPFPGKLAKQYFQPGQLAIKGKPLYDIELASSQSVKKPAEAESQQRHAEAMPKTQEIVAVQPEERQTSPSIRIKESGKKALAAPPVRKLARDLGIDINLVPGTGKEDIVTIKDIANFHAGYRADQTEPTTRPEAEKVPILNLSGDEVKPLIGIRNLMAKRMAESKENIPHFSYFEQVEATRLVQLKENIKKEARKEGYHVTFMPLLIRALSLTISRYPEVNSSLDLKGNRLVIHRKHNIGIAITTPMGLIVPVLKDVQEKTLEQLIREYEDLKNRASTNKLLSSDMKEATITISNFGVLGGGGLWATPIINYPEAAILALARIQKQPIVKNDTLVVRDVLNLSWSFDHRIIDGDMAAAFSHHYSTLMLNPAQLL